MKLTLALIMINVAVFVYMAFYTNPSDFIKQYGFSVKAFKEGKYHTIFTSMFLHASISHLASNMIALFFLGSSIEKRLGKLKMLTTYILSGIAGNFSMFIPMFSSPDTIGVGASAAISGLVGLGTFATSGRLVLFPSFFPFPFIVAGAIYLLVTISNLFEVSHVAHHAHLFGLLAGSSIGLALTKHRIRKILAFFLILLIISMLPLIIGYFM
ncbi:MAG: rhomboid family intramembrane serine protease [Candidatus Aenigmarchaeota archaeon]|nr:rhomboid family intramembrane serine protease [Candidatus Aenigmarchaeota archaeon]